MPSLIANCLNRLVKAGRITQRAADAAQALHDGMQGRLGAEINPTHADAAAALEAARAMAAAARQRKLGAALKAIRLDEGLGRMAAHPRGESAGLVSILTVDPWNATRGLNVENHSETVLGAIMKRAGAVLEPFRSRAAGLRQDTAGIRNVIRELYGIDTGDAVAKAAAKAWREAVDYAVGRHAGTGAYLSLLDNWLLPQFWERSRVQKFRAAFARDVLEAAETRGLTIMDRTTGEAATPLKAPAIVAKALDDILLGRHAGTAGKGFNREMRVFRFNDPETWLRLMDKYGPGQGGVYSMMVGHMRGMSREIALKEILSPDYPAVFNALHEQARRAKLVTGTAGGIVARNLTGPRMAELAYRDLTGQLSSPQSEAVAGFFGGLRNIKTASSLGSAVISAIPGDTVTMTWATRANGIPAVAALRRTLDTMLADSATKREAAARLNIVSHAVMDATLGSKRFEDQVVGQNFPGRVASTVIRASGLQAWTEGAKRAFSMEFLGTIADQTRFTWNNLDGSFRGFLERYGFTPADWDTLRATPLLDVEGGTFFDTEAAGKLGDRLSNAIIDERHYAVIEPTSLTRAVSTQGTQRGTIIGEITRSSFMFKSFAVTILLTHVMRTLATGPVGSRAFRFAGFMATMTLAGAASLQAKQIIAGRDPRDMTTGDFWLNSFAQGGGLGIYGDFLYQSINRGGQGLLSTLAGPVIGEVGGTVDFIRTLIDPAPGGKQRGEALAQYLRRWTPGSTLWYARLAVDRYIFDFMQRMIDPGAEGAFRRQARAMQRDYGQRFWWAPGTSAPQRGPDMGAALPN